MKNRISIWVIMLIVILVNIVMVYADNTLTLYPTDDVFTYEAHPTEQNNGNNIQARYQSGWSHQSWLKYDISSLSGKRVISATVTVTLQADQPAYDNTILLEYTTDDNWTETNITWNTQPTNVNYVNSSITVASSAPSNTAYTFPLSSALVESLNDDTNGLFSLRLRSSTYGDYRNSKFYSKEGAGANNSYQARITLVVHDIQNCDVTEDAYAYDGSGGNNNYGSVSYMLVKNASAGYNRQAFMKFDTSYIAKGNVASAKLSFYSEGTNAQVLIYCMDPAESWSEDTLTWNNMPTTTEGPRVATYTLTPGSSATPVLQEIDITDPAVLSLFGGGDVTLRMHGGIYNGNTATISSKEHYGSVYYGATLELFPPAGTVIIIH